VQNFEEKLDCFRLGSEEVHQPLTATADPSPASHDGYFTKKGWPDRKRVISGHVPVGVDPLAIKLVVVCSHPRMIGDARDLVQRDL